MSQEQQLLEQEFRAEVARRVMAGPDVRICVQQLALLRLSDKTRTALIQAALIFYVPSPEKNLAAAFAVIYQDHPATIAHAEYWDSLDQFCNALYEIGGIRNFIIKGSDLFVEVKREGERWVREVVAKD